MVLFAVAGLALGAMGAIELLPRQSTGPAAEPQTPVSTAPRDIASASVAAPTAPAVDAAAPPTPAVVQTPRALEDIVSGALPAVVSIETAEGRGSGFFTSPHTVVTNRHVVGSNSSVTVRLASGATLSGRVENASAEMDLAIVKVDGASASQPTLPLGTASAVRAGQEVIAIGLALGVFQNTVTRGIVSAIRQTGSVVVIQTDAAINPGNSGGPLLDRNGDVIGINSLKITGSAESLGFAIAIDHARALLSGAQPVSTGFGGQSNDPLAPAFHSSTDTDLARETAARTFEQRVQIVARRAAVIDDYWARIKGTCTMQIAPGYDREWFGLWDGRTEAATPDPGCLSGMRDVGDMANGVKTAMGALQEEARHASVLPGDLREIRRRYRLDWAGFDR
jgi:S1-C subfamily serine protease